MVYPDRGLRFTWAEFDARAERLAKGCSRSDCGRATTWASGRETFPTG